MLPVMFGLILVSIVVGTLASLVAIADPRHARTAPFIGFPALSGGTGALLFSFAFGGAGHALDASLGLQTLSGLGFFFGYIGGGGGRGVIGFCSRLSTRAEVERLDSSQQSSFLDPDVSLKQRGRERGGGHVQGEAAEAFDHA